MSSVVVIGAQWGDEGKGKIVDYLAQKANAVVRYSGGSNAGHTVVVDDVAYKLRLLPSGVLYKDKINILGNGVVINPAVVLQEIAGMKAQGIDCSNLLISDRAHVVMPYHAKLDELQEAALGEHKIGTTKGGIGPCYMDKVARTGIRICDLMEPDTFADKLRVNLAAKNEIITKIYGGEPFDYDSVLKEYLAYAEELRPHVCDTGVVLGEVFEAGKNVLFEGAQATFLDIDHGTYPYVTSSHPVAGGCCIGSGVGPTAINEIMGIFKSYTTRVGEGPFPTELFDETGNYIREKGGEYGTTTGRPRRTGWFDAVIMRHAVRVNGLTSLAINKFDTLAGLPVLKVCVAYKTTDGQTLKDFPVTLEELAKCSPIYEEIEGYEGDLSACKTFDELPEKAQAYVKRLEELCGCPIKFLGIGPGRDQIIYR